MTHHRQHNHARLTALLASLAMTLGACDDAAAPDADGTQREPGAPATIAADTAATEAGIDFTTVVAAEAVSQEGHALGGVSMGNPDAPVTIIEYASLTCGHCASFHLNVLPPLKEKYISTGKVRYVVYNFLLNRTDIAASMLVRCKGPDQFFPLTDIFFARQREWLSGASTNEQLLDNMASLLRRAGVSRTEFDQCLAQRDLQSHLVEMTQDGQQEWQITGTPTIIINGEKRGPEAQFFDSLSEIIEDEL